MIKRTIKESILNDLEVYPVVIVTGPRQIGKSTLVNQIAIEKKINYVSLDDISKRKLANDDPTYFIESHGYPLIIDEIQYAPILMEVIESIVNKRRLEQNNPYGLFILTGSQTYQLMKGVTQSLAGRASIIEMSTLSNNEINSREEVPFNPSYDVIKNKKIHLKSSKEVFDMIYFGQFPELFNNKKISREKFYENYISTYIDRDVFDIINIKNKLTFHNFMEVIASYTGQELTYDNIAKVVGISVSTVKEWVSVLQTSGFINLLQSYNETSINKRVVKRPKVCFCDTGLVCHLIKINDARTLEASRFAGQLLETFVYNEVRKSYTNNNRRPNLYYYRDNHQNEVDFILIENGYLHCIECKKGMYFDIEDTKAFDCLKNTMYNIGDSCIISLSDKVYALKRGIFVYPISVI